MTHKPSKPDADALLEQAIDWMLRSEQAPDDVELRRELAAWLAADPGHAYAWQRARNVWNTMGGMEPDRSQWPAAVEAADDATADDEAPSAAAEDAVAESEKE